MHNSSRLHLVASEQERLQPSPCSISRSPCNVKPPRKQEELKAPDRDSAFKGFEDCKKHLVKSTCLKCDLEDKCQAFVCFSLTSRGIAGVHQFPMTDFIILAPMQLR